MNVLGVLKVIAFSVWVGALVLSLYLGNEFAFAASCMVLLSLFRIHRLEVENDRLSEVLQAQSLHRLSVHSR